MNRRLFFKGILSSIALGLSYKVNANFIKQDEISSIDHKKSNILPVFTKRQVAINVESTGLGIEYCHRVVSLTAVEIINGVVTGRYFDTLINPEREIEEGPIEVHGITNECVIDAPKFSEVISGFYDFLASSDEVVVSNSSFHVDFINNELRLNGGGYLPIDKAFNIVDNRLLAKRLLPGKPKYNLDAICGHLNLDLNKYEKNKKDKYGYVCALQLADTYLELRTLQGNGLG